MDWMVFSPLNALRGKISGNARKGFGSCIEEGIQAPCPAKNCIARDLICGLWIAAVNNTAFSLRRKGGFFGIRKCLEKGEVLEIMVSPLGGKGLFLLEVGHGGENWLLRYRHGRINPANGEVRRSGGPALDIFLCEDKEKLLERGRDEMQPHTPVCDMESKGICNLHFFCKE